MKVEFSKEEIERLLSLVAIGSLVGIEVLSLRGQEFGHVADLEQKLFSYAAQAGLFDLIEKHNDHLDLSHDFAHGIELMVDEFAEQRFWSDLAQELGERDFLAGISPSEREEIERTGAFPETIAQVYEKYAAEFDEHGVDRLIIDGARSTNDER